MPLCRGCPECPGCPEAHDQERFRDRLGVEAMRLTRVRGWCGPAADAAAVAERSITRVAGSGQPRRRQLRAHFWCARVCIHTAMHSLPAARGLSSPPHVLVRARPGPQGCDVPVLVQGLPQHAFTGQGQQTRAAKFTDGAL